MRQMYHAQVLASLFCILSLHHGADALPEGNRSLPRRDIYDQNPYTIPDSALFDLFKNVEPAFPSMCWGSSQLFNIDEPLAKTGFYRGIANDRQDLCAIYDRAGGPETLVIATAVNAPAFRPTWISLLFSVLTTVIPLIWVHLNEDADRDRVSPAFWVGMLVDCGRVGWWWFSFFDGVRDISTMPWLNTVMWVTPAAYIGFLVHGTGSAKVDAVCFAAPLCLALLTLAQWAASFAILIMHLASSRLGANAYAPLDYAGQTANLPPDFCALENLSPDFWAETQSRAFVGWQMAQFVISSLAFCATVFWVASRKMKTVYLPLVLIAGYVPLIFIQAFALVFGGGATVHYATRPCSLVVVFMHGKSGYFDVQWSLAKRVVTSVLGVGY